MMTFNVSVICRSHQIGQMFRWANSTKARLVEMKASKNDRFTRVCCFQPLQAIKTQL